jgi:hypothetical protein
MMRPIFTMIVIVKTASASGARRSWVLDQPARQPWPEGGITGIGSGLTYSNVGGRFRDHRGSGLRRHRERPDHIQRRHVGSPERRPGERHDRVERRC